MPNITKIVCGKTGGIGLGGAIRPSETYTVIPGSPKTVLTVTVQYGGAMQRPMTAAHDLPADDPMLLETLRAVSELEAVKSNYDYYSEITLDDGTQYTVSYQELSPLILALWREHFGIKSFQNPTAGFADSPVLAPPPGSWNCLACGQPGITGNYCFNCGSRKPPEM